MSVEKGGRGEVIWGGHKMTVCVCVCVRVCVCVVDGMQPNSQTKYEWHGNEANSFQCIGHALFVLFMANM